MRCFDRVAQRRRTEHGDDAVVHQYAAEPAGGGRAKQDQLALCGSIERDGERFAPRIAVLAEQMEEFVARHSFDDFVFLGQGPFHGIAREAALKVMEMSCSYSQVFHALEFRHGPKAIVSEKMCLTFLLSDSGGKAETEVLEEMKALGGVDVFPSATMR